MWVVSADGERLAIDPVQCRQRARRNCLRLLVQPDLVGVGPGMPFLDTPVTPRLQEDTRALRSLSCSSSACGMLSRQADSGAIPPRISVAEEDLRSPGR